jgi:hypothetical protein
MLKLVEKAIKRANISFFCLVDFSQSDSYWTVGSPELILASPIAILVSDSFFLVR